jgi:hypothetical protein
MTEEKKEDPKLVMDDKTGLFSFEKETITIEEHNEEMLKTMTEFAEVVELSILRERDACAKIALEHKSEEIAKAIRERVPAQSTAVH